MSPKPKPVSAVTFDASLVSWLLRARLGAGRRPADPFRSPHAQEAEDLVSTFFLRSSQSQIVGSRSSACKTCPESVSVPAPESLIAPRHCGWWAQSRSATLQTQSSIKVLALPSRRGQLSWSNSASGGADWAVKPGDRAAERSATPWWWGSSCHPKVEDGNKSSSVHPEDTVDQLWTVESTAASYLRRFSTYYNTRAKLVSKIVKYPPGGDYRRTVAEARRKMSTLEW